MTTGESRRVDAVVLGSGLGGLAAAARLAREGMSVVVAERHEQAGGYASAFVREGFSFEVSLHLIDAVRVGEPNYRLLLELGIEPTRDLAFLSPDTLRREVWPTHDLAIPSGESAYLDLLSSHFPAQRDGIRASWELARAAHGAFHDGDNESASLDSSALSPLSNLGRSTAGAVIDAHIDDPRLRAMLGLFGRGWLGLPLDSLAAIQFLVPWFSFHHYGGAYPRGGSAAIVRALANVIERAGGTIATSCAVERIHVERNSGSVRGVTLSNGHHLETCIVISNASPRATAQLIDDDNNNAPPPDEIVRWRARIDRIQPSVSCIKLWLGLDAPLESMNDYDLYIRSSYGADDDAISITNSSALLPDQPPVIAITSLVEPTTATSELTHDDATALLLERARRAIPSLRPERIVARAVATPATFERFTNNPTGAIYGARASVEQCGARRLPQRTPYDGLWLAGAWTQPGAGFSTVLRSGRDAARTILSHRRPR